MDRETTPGPSRPFQRGLLGRAPPGRRPALRLREPAQRMLQRGGGRSGRVPGREARRPGSGSASGLGPGEGPSGRAGSQSGPAGSGLRRFRQPSGGGGGPRVRGTATRAWTPASGLSSAPRKRETPSDPPSLAGRKVTSAGPGARARGCVGTGSAHVLQAVRRRRGRGEGAADAGCSPRLPAPLCRIVGGSAELRRGHTPRDGAEKASLVLTPIPECGGGGHRCTLGLLRGNSLLSPGVGVRLETTPGYSWK